MKKSKFTQEQIESQSAKMREYWAKKKAAATSTSRKAVIYFRNGTELSLPFEEVTMIKYL